MVARSGENAYPWHLRRSGLQTSLAARMNMAEEFARQRKHPCLRPRAGRGFNAVSRRFRNTRVTFQGFKSRSTNLGFRPLVRR